MSEQTSNPAEADPADDLELMRRVGEGDRESFERLVGKYQRPLLNFFSRLGVYMEAEDMVQETFMRLYRYRTRYRPAARFTTFLYTIARHVWVDGLRKKRRFETYAEEVRRIGQTSGPRQHAGGAVRLDVHEALQQLPERLRAVVVLCVMQDQPQAEAARILRIPLGTVKSRLFTALQRMKEWIDDQPGS